MAVGRVRPKIISSETSGVAGSLPDVPYHSRCKSLRGIFHMHRVATINVSKQHGLDQRLKTANPLTRANRELPPMNFLRQLVAMNILLNKDTNNYKILVAGTATIDSADLSRKTYIYGSITQEWKVVGNAPGPECSLNAFPNWSVLPSILQRVGFMSTAGTSSCELSAYQCMLKTLTVTFS